jgi:hypothetical protein
MRIRKMVKNNLLLYFNACPDELKQQILSKHTHYESHVKKDSCYDVDIGQKD